MLEPQGRLQRTPEGTCRFVLLGLGSFKETIAVLLAGAEPWAPSAPCREMCLSASQSCHEEVQGNQADSPTETYFLQDGDSRAEVRVLAGPVPSEARGRVCPRLLMCPVSLWPAASLSGWQSCPGLHLHLHLSSSWYMCLCPQCHFLWAPVLTWGPVPLQGLH